MFKRKTSIECIYMHAMVHRRRCPMYSLYFMLYLIISCLCIGITLYLQHAEKVKIVWSKISNQAATICIWMWTYICMFRWCLLSTPWSKIDRVYCPVYLAGTVASVVHIVFFHNVVLNQIHILGSQWDKSYIYAALACKAWFHWAIYILKCVLHACHSA